MARLNDKSRMSRRRAACPHRMAVEVLPSAWPNIFRLQIAAVAGCCSNDAMITLLADSNALRHVGLKAYLAHSRNHAIALSDLTLVEMRKSNALSTSRDSLLIASQYLQQVYVLSRTDEMLGENITSGDQVANLFDYQAGIDRSLSPRPSA